MNGVRPLLLLLGLVAGAVALVHLAPPVPETMRPSLLGMAPLALGRWSGADGAPESILPKDPNETGSVRRTYARDGQTAWVAVSLFTRQDVPARRASVNHLYPQRHTVRIERLAVPITFGGATQVAVPATVVRMGDRERLVVMHWHQMGSTVYRGDYSYRLALMWRTLTARRADSTLVRIAFRVVDGAEIGPALASARDIAPAIHASLARRAGS